MIVNLTILEWSDCGLQEWTGTSLEMGLSG